MAVDRIFEMDNVLKQIEAMKKLTIADIRQCETPEGNYFFDLLFDADLTDTCISVVMKLGIPFNIRVNSDLVTDNIDEVLNYLISRLKNQI